MSRKNCDESDGSSYVVVGDNNEDDDSNILSSSSDESSYVHVSSNISVDFNSMVLVVDDQNGDVTTAAYSPVKIHNDDDNRHINTHQTKNDNGFDDGEAESKATKSSSSIGDDESSTWSICEGTFEEAIIIAKNQKKLVLVSLQQQDDGKKNRNFFESFAIYNNPDIQKGLHQFKSLVADRYIFIQLSVQTNEGAGYAKKFQVDKFPHLGVLHPIHRTILWGIDGTPPCWKADRVMERLVDCGCVNYTLEHFEQIEADYGMMINNGYNNSIIKNNKQVVKPVSIKRRTTSKYKKIMMPSSSSRTTNNKSRHNDGIIGGNKTTTEELYMIQEAILDINLDDPMEVARFFQLQQSWG